MDKFRASVRPLLTFAFAIPFVGLAVYSFIRFGTEQLAMTLMAGFIGSTNLIIGIYFQSRNQKQP
jgi:hypothetical protein